VQNEANSNILYHSLPLMPQKYTNSMSSVMWFSMKSICTDALPAISVNNTVLKVVSHQNNFGIVFDDKLQWSPVCKSMSYYLYMIGSHCTSLTKSISKMLVESLVLSRMR